jgi:hypothetical protein
MEDTPEHSLVSLHQLFTLLHESNETLAKVARSLHRLQQTLNCFNGILIAQEFQDVAMVMGSDWAEEMLERIREHADDTQPNWDG